MKAFIAGLCVAVLVVVAFASTTVVGAGQRGVVVRLGNVQDRVLDEGLHFKTPLIERVVKIDVTTNKIETGADAASSDLQSVTTTVALNYSVNPEAANAVYQEFRKDFRSRLIDPAIQEAVKAATAKFTAEELITKRPEVKEEMRIALNDRLLANGIIVKDISIVNFAFSPSFNQAIEEKQVAEQRALQAERDLQRIEIEKEQAIAAAEGEAEAIRIKAEALRSNPDLIELNAVEQWNGILPTYLMGDAVPFLNIQ